MHCSEKLPFTGLDKITRLFVVANYKGNERWQFKAICF
jgi:hypothetical protein